MIAEYEQMVLGSFVLFFLDIDGDVRWTITLFTSTWLPYDVNASNTSVHLHNPNLLISSRNRFANRAFPTRDFQPLRRSEDS